MVRYNGLIHDYGLLNALSQVPGVRLALLQAFDGLKQQLQLKRTRGRKLHLATRVLSGRWVSALA